MVPMARASFSSRASLGLLRSTLLQALWHLWTAVMVLRVVRVLASLLSGLLSQRQLRAARSLQSLAAVRTQLQLLLRRLQHRLLRRPRCPLQRCPLEGSQLRALMSQLCEVLMPVMDQAQAVLLGRPQRGDARPSAWPLHTCRARRRPTPQRQQGHLPQRSLALHLLRQLRRPQRRRQTCARAWRWSSRSSLPETLRRSWTRGRTRERSSWPQRRDVLFGGSSGWRRRRRPLRHQVGHEAACLRAMSAGL